METNILEIGSAELLNSDTPAGVSPLAQEAGACASDVAEGQSVQPPAQQSEDKQSISLVTNISQNKHTF